MTFLDSFVASRWAEAIGWVLLHSLWQGALVCVCLAAVLLATKSPRVRYAAACLALAAIFAAFVITLFRLAPQPLSQVHIARALQISPWRQAVLQNTRSWNLSLDAIARWLPPFWIAGVLIFYLRYAAGFVALARLKRRGTCGVPEVWQQKLSTLSAQLRVSRPVVLLEIESR